MSFPCPTPPPHVRSAAIRGGIRLLAVLTSILCFGFASGVRAQDSADWTLSAHPAESSDGVFQLRWEGGEGAVALEEAQRADFSDARVLYVGEDRAALLSGRASGVYHYRLRAGDRAGSVLADVQVDVSHRSLSTAFTFFGVGLVVFLATVALVVSGSRASAREAST